MGTLRPPQMTRLWSTEYKNCGARRRWPLDGKRRPCCFYICSKIEKWWLYREDIQLYIYSYIYFDIHLWYDTYVYQYLYIIEYNFNYQEVWWTTMSGRFDHLCLGSKCSGVKSSERCWIQVSRPSTRHQFYLLTISNHGSDGSLISHWDKATAFL